MKKILIAAIAAQAAPTLLAHEMQGGSTSGLLGLKPEYLHVLLNPLPAYGLAIGVLVLLAGFIRRNCPIRLTGLVLCTLCAASAWPALYFGQHGYNSLYPQLDTESQQWLDAHMSRAERFIYFFYAAAALGLSALIFRKSPKAFRWLAVSTLALSCISLGLGAWIARAGGEVSHSEFRSEQSPPEAPAHEHQHSGHPAPSSDTNAPETHQHDETHAHPAEQTSGPATEHSEHAESAHQHGTTVPQSSTDPPAHHHETAAEAATNAPTHQHEHATASPNQTNQPSASHQHEHTSSAAPAHSHGTNAPPVSPANWMPDTPEGIWRELHRHQAELQPAIAAKQIDKTHAHAEAVKRLTAALVEVVHPDYKASVEKGAEKINQAISAAHRSAHADDIAGVEANFKQFSDALQQLEEQMKKQ